MASGLAQRVSEAERTLVRQRDVKDRLEQRIAALENDDRFTTALRFNALESRCTLLETVLNKRQEAAELEDGS